MSKSQKKKILITRISKNYSFKHNSWVMNMVLENGTNLKRMFTDYFWVKENRVNDIERIPNINVYHEKIHKNIYGETVIYCTYDNIKLRKQLLNDKSIKYDIYDLDIDVTTKFLINNPDIEFSTNRHIVFFDIETKFNENNKNTNKPDLALEPITSIQLYSTKFNEYFIFAWHPSIKLTEEDDGIMITDEKIEDENIRYFVSNKEIDMLNAFEQVYEHLNPDIISGWFSDGYDVPYIINRYKLLNRSLDIWGSYVKTRYSKFKNKFYNTLTGVDHIDFMEAFLNVGYKLPNNKLDTAAKHILGDEYSKIKDYTWKDWEDSFYEFLKYGFRDVQILKKINERLHSGLFNFLYSMQNLASLPQLNYAFKNIAKIDNLIYKTYKDKYVFPGIHPNDIRKIKYKGAVVQNPLKSGVLKNVAVFDYSSLYPTIMAAYNISPETFVATQEKCEYNNIDIDNDIVRILDNQNIKYIDTGYNEDLVGKRYILLSQKEKMGMISELEFNLYYERQKIKKTRDNYKPSTIDYQMYDHFQTAYKVYINSIYGILASNYFRFGKIECADLITDLGRQSILYAKKYFKDVYGLECQYIDTDSTFIHFGEDKIDLLEKVKKEIPKFNKSLLENVVKKYNPHIDEKYFIMNLEFEKLLTHIYFSNTKKRYYGIQENGKKYIRGINIIRKDTPTSLKPKLDNIAELAVLNKLEYKHINDIVEFIKTEKMQNIGVFKSFNQNFADYSNLPQHVRGAILANDEYNCNITENDVPYMFYVKHKNKDTNEIENTVICLNESDLNIFNENDNIEIDYDVYIDKQLVSPLEEFDRIDNLKLLLHQYKLNNKDYYEKSYFKKVERIMKKIDNNKPLTKGYVEFIEKYKICFDEFKNLNINELNIK